MREWKFWDWAGFGSLWVVVLMEAYTLAQRGLASDFPPITGLFGFLPLILLTIATLVLIARAFQIGHQKNRVAPQPGLKFFSDRDSLERNRSLDAQLAQASEVDAIFMVGRKLQELEIKNIRRLKRVILPNPNGQSAITYAKTVDQLGHFQRHIAEATKSLRDEHKIEVKWWPDPLYHSILMGDSDKSTGWLHIESALPFSKLNVRPSFTVERRSFENLVTAMSGVFTKMWGASEAPNEATLAKFLSSSAERRAVEPPAAFRAFLTAEEEELLGRALDTFPHEERFPVPIFYSAEGTTESANAQALATFFRRHRWATTIRPQETLAAGREGLGIALNP